MKNTNLLESTSDIVDGEFVKIDKNLESDSFCKFIQKNLESEPESSIYHNLYTSSDKPDDTKKIKLPNLFSITENYPRYIRGSDTTNKKRGSDTTNKKIYPVDWSSDTSNYNKGEHYHLLFAKDSGARSGESIEYILLDTTGNNTSNNSNKDNVNILLGNTEILENTWASYCLNNNKPFFAGFQPIPTAGIMIDTKAWNFRYNYIDAQGESHKIKSNNKKTEQKTKISESEAAYPISREGGAAFSIIHKNKTYKNAAKYFLHGISNEKIGEKKFKWRTMTSLPIMNCDKLGVGDVTKNIDITTKNTSNDYYITNNVTDVLKKDVTYIAPKIKLQYEKDVKTADDDSPYPSTLNLLPLIRL